MSLITLFLLLVVGMVFSFKRWRKSARGMFAAALILFFGIGCGPIPAWLLDGQAVFPSAPPAPWGNQNTIVLLGGGIESIPHASSGSYEAEPFAYGRIVKAADLYHSCKASSTDCKIIVSGGDAKRKGSTEAAVYGHVLASLGVRSDDLMLEAKSKNTWQNAQFTSELLKSREGGRTLLVSSGIHLRRSLLYFSHFGQFPIPVRADYFSPAMSLVPAAYNFTMADFAISELIGIARYYLYNVLGLNGLPTPQK